MERHSITSDLTVIGGGLAGTCAAIAAARLGRSVSLVQNRPVLGGNSSSEVRVWVCGATSHGTQRYARETGIIGALFVENQFVNQEGNPYLWDLVVLEAVRREANIGLYLNTDVHHVRSADDGSIAAVTGWQMGSERELTFTSPLYLDCTGDGLIGALAGADFRIGREASGEYGESLAPAVADRAVLGSSILFYTKDAGRPVPFVPPSFAVDIAASSIAEQRVIRSGDNGCAYWWIECGGDRDTVHDNEGIRDDLWGIVYGIWDYIKNSGRFPEAESRTLEWVGAIPGKRESRRFVGDHVLTQHDILGQVHFEDGVAFGGWSIDLHPPAGVFDAGAASTHVFSDGIYEIPYRCLYSRNVGNLLFAGRNVSASHVAFASTRVMATCAALGEAAGSAAALCLEHGVTPRGLYEHHRATLVQTLLRQDACVIGVANQDPDDLARSANVAASSHVERVSVTRAGEPWPLDADAAVTLPIERAMDSLALLVNAEHDAELVLDVYGVSRPQNFVPDRLLARGSTTVPRGARQWIDVPVGLTLDTPSFVFVIIRAAPGLALHRSPEPLTGVLSYTHQLAVTSGDANEGHNDQPLRVWNPKPLHRAPFCLQLSPASRVFAPENVINGYARPYGAPNVWLSARQEDDPQPWLELRWTMPQRLRRVLITFNDDVNEDLINLHHHRTPFRVIPELVRDYELQAQRHGAWQTVASVRGHRARRAVHHLALDDVSVLRLTVLATNGSPHTEVFEIRAYAT